MDKFGTYFILCVRKTIHDNFPQPSISDNDRQRSYYIRHQDAQEKV